MSYFKIGDRVKIARVIVSTALWDDGWVESMDHTVGLTGTVNTLVTGGAVVYLDNKDFGGYWSYPIEALERIEDAT